MDDNNKKGISKEAKEYSGQVTKRFIEFVKKVGMKEISEKTGCNYQALRNSVSGGYNPSLDTLCQVKLGYMSELDINYLFTGIKSEDEALSKIDDDQPSNNYTRLLEEQVRELKKDKEFLQNLVNKQSNGGL